MYFRAALLCKTTGEFIGFCFYLFLCKATKVQCILTDLAAVFRDFIAFGNLVTSSFLICICGVTLRPLLPTFLHIKESRKESSAILWAWPLRKSDCGHFESLELLSNLETLRTTRKLCMLRT